MCVYIFLFIYLSIYFSIYNGNARGSAERIARIVTIVYLSYYPPTEFPTRFSQSAEGWKYSGCMRNYRQRRERKGTGAMVIVGPGDVSRLVPPVVRATQRLLR